MRTIAFVRGAFLNQFEGQNFLIQSKKISLQGFSSMYPIHHTLPFPVTRLPSLFDLNAIPGIGTFNLYQKAIKYISNRTIGDSQILFGLEKLVKGFDIADTGDPYYYYSYQLARMRHAGLIKKLIITYYETIAHNNESVARKKTIKYFTMAQADMFICRTELSKKALAEEGVDTSKVRIVRLGVDLNRFKPGYHKKSSITLLFVGRLVEEKGILDLYHVFKMLKKTGRYENVFLNIVGTGELHEKLDQDIRKDGLSKWVTITVKSYDDIPEVYRHADIFILPSKRTTTWEEQYGMVLIEAMASGLPIIATKSGAIAEVVGEAGLLATEGDRNSLYKMLCRLLDNPDLRAKYSAQSSARAVRSFDSRKTAELIGTIYSRLAAGN